MNGGSDSARERIAVASTPPPALPGLWNLLFRPTARLRYQFARYFVVGGLAFVIDFGLLYLLTEFAGLHYLVSAAIGFTCGLVTSYSLSLLWVFDRRAIKSAPVEFTIFATIGLVGLALNEVIIWFVREEVHLHYLAAKMVSTAIVLFWNFGARKLVLFR